MKQSHLAILAVVVSFLGCTDTGTDLLLPLDSSIDGRTVLYPVRKTFVLELDVNFDAGYQWDLSISDPVVVRLDSVSFRPKQAGPPIVGGLAVETFYFRTTGSGTCIVTLIEHRAWEPDVPPVNTVVFSVSVYD